MLTIRNSMPNLKKFLIDLNEIKHTGKQQRVEKSQEHIQGIRNFANYPAIMEISTSCLVYWSVLLLEIERFDFDFVDANQVDK